MATKSSMNYTLVDTVEKAKEAIKVLNEYTQLSVDCEGVNLGRDGELCLMQIAIPSKVYLFDIVELKEEVFDLGLKKILESTSITKLLYDCREDCNALKHLYKINVQGVEDIQLLNSLLMKLTGKGAQCVTGLQKCMDYHMRGCGFSGYQKEKIHKALDNDKTLWRKRPMSDEFLTYAATDVFYLSSLRDRLYVRLAYKAPRTDLIEVLKYASTRYADFMRDNTSYKRDSPYFRTARLPERIIPEMTKVGGKWTYTPFSSTTGMKCRTCNWLTDSRSSGQCKRCYLIDHPAEFERQYQPSAKRVRLSVWDYDY